MAQLTLKNIIGKKNEMAANVLSLIEQLNIDVIIEDEKGKVFFSNTSASLTNQYPVLVDDQVVGFVKGSEKALTIANLLTLLLQKESEKKKLGNEVLNLYQEINLIFNFSEELAQTIEPEAIAEMALKEARHLIASHGGAVVLWNEQLKRFEIIASSGELFLNAESINGNINLLIEIALNGQSSIITDISNLLNAGVILPNIQTLVFASLKVKHRIMGAIILAGHEEVQYSAIDLKLLTTISLQSSSAIEAALLYDRNIREAKEREESVRRIYDVAAKFVPYEFIGSLGHDVITDVRLGDQVQKIVTVLFSDIRDYTSISEGMTPEENFRFVCSFNERMGPIIRKNGGFINQYLGDAIMAIFPGNASDALAAAIEMQLSVQEFNEQQTLKNKPTIDIGVGMHTGALIMGITGDKERMDATTISDTVNTASRIESLTKHYKGNIIITEDTYRQISSLDSFHLRPLGRVNVKGKQAALIIYECFTGNAPGQLQNKLATLALFNEAINHYLNKSFVSAISTFSRVLEQDPYDQTAKFFLKNSMQFFETDMSEVVKMKEK